MKKQTLYCLLSIVFYISSCIKAPLENSISPVASTTNIKVPSGFNWASAATINLTVNVTDNRFQQNFHFISVFDGNPAEGASLLAKGSATISAPFICKFNLSNNKKELYIVKLSSDNIEKVKQLVVTGFTITTSIGQ